MGNNLAIMMVIISKKRFELFGVFSVGFRKRNLGKTEKGEENLGISEKTNLGGKRERVMRDW